MSTGGAAANEGRMEEGTSSNGPHMMNAWYMNQTRDFVWSAGASKIHAQSIVYICFRPAFLQVLIKEIQSKLGTGGDKSPLGTLRSFFRI